MQSFQNELIKSYKANEELVTPFLFSKCVKCGVVDKSRRICLYCNSLCVREFNLGSDTIVLAKKLYTHLRLKPIGLCVYNDFLVVKRMQKVLSIIEAERRNKSPYGIVVGSVLHQVSCKNYLTGQGLETKMCKVYRSKNSTNLFLLNIEHRWIREVSNKEFSEASGFVAVLRNMKFRVLGGTRQDFAKLKTNLIHLQGQVLEGVLTTVKDMLNLGYRITSIAANVLSREKIRETQLLVADWVSFLLQSCSGTYNNWTIPYLTGFLVRIATLYQRGKTLAGQSLDGVLLLAAASGMSNSMVDVLKKLNLLTGKKIGDHPNVFLEFFLTVSEFLCDLIEGAQWIPVETKKFLLRVFKSGAVQKLIMRANELSQIWEKNKNIMLNSSFRVRVLNLEQSFLSQVEFHALCTNNNLFKQAYEKIHKMSRAVKSYEKCSRQEPVCMVLEGPPGVRKTIAALQIVQLLGRSTYSHVVKPTEDGKDFYDGYNNEEVFVMDDVGQQGVSQWRTVINMVSSIKLPLDCAEVSMKDTKYFDSKVMLLTTNNFSNLTGLTKSDGISEITALWRRAHVLRFVHANRCEYWRFDIYKNRWEQTYPIGSNIDYPVQVEGDTTDIAEWATGLTILLERHYDAVIRMVELSSVEVESRRRKIDERISYVQAQDLSGLMEMSLDWLTTVHDCLNDWLLKIADYLGNVTTSSSLLAVLGGLGFIYFIRSLLGERKTVSPAEQTVMNWRRELSNKTRKVALYQEGGIVMQGSEPTSTLVMAVKKNVKLITVVGTDDQTQTSHGFVSGSKILMVSHTVKSDKGRLIIYKDDTAFLENKREYDLSPYRVISRDVVRDIVILELPTLNLTPYAVANHHLVNTNYELAPAKKLWFVWAGGVESLEGVCYDNLVNTEYKTFDRTVKLEGALAYSFGSPGFCGALIVDEVCGIVGMHVAGRESGYGVARIFPKTERQRIKSYMDSVVDSSAELVDIKGKYELPQGFSGMIKETEKRSDGPKVSHLKPSLLAGIFPETKRPAQLRSLGPQTVKLRALRNHKPSVYLPNEEIEFMRKYVNIVLPSSFSPLTIKEVVKGVKEDKRKLAALNKDSVSGLDFPKDKSCYFDFEQGEVKEEFLQALKEYRREAIKGYPALITQHHTLKDELRVLEKVHKPRTFGVDSLVTQFEMKRLLGNVMMYAREHRHFTGIMIGLNPYAEFDEIRKKLSKSVRVWDGDIGEWDASVSPQIQDMLNEEICKRFDGEIEDRLILERVLQLSVRSWVVAGNKEFFKTHGILSGMWITNLFNSIINRCYTAGWYYRELKKQGLQPNINKFFEDVAVYVQGDDQLCGVFPSAHSVLNASTMCEYYESCGMTYTNGKKGKVDYESLSLEEVVFLKRKFVYHAVLNKYVGALDLETITNSLMWYKDDNDPEVIIRDKMRAAQIELYLHKYSENKDEAVRIWYTSMKVLEMKGVKITPFPEDYIKDLFEYEPDEILRMYMKLTDKNY